MKYVFQRKSIRLKDYDYSSNGAYHITICSKNREHIFWDETQELSPIGQSIDDAINQIALIYAPFVTVDSYIIMPNHIHMILFIHNDGTHDNAPQIPRIIQQFKGTVSKKCGFPVWHKSYYDHIIRSEIDYNDTILYITANPEYIPKEAFDA